MSGLLEIIGTGFLGKRILVVGDLVADQFLRGTIGRVSREAPVFILRHEDTETLGGGAANAAVNVSKLGGKADLVGLVGIDPNGRELLTALSNNDVNVDGCISSDSFQTTTKLRVLAGQQYARRQQVIRIDYENAKEIDDAALQRLETNTLEMLDEADAVIISDYGYGVVRKELGQRVIKAASALEIPVIVDSRNRLEDLAGATAATPNKEEVEKLLDGPITPEGAVRLRSALDLRALLVTLGNEGMILAVEGQEPEIIDIVGKDEPVDVTGAGDTVIATFALGVAAGLGFSTSAKIANHAGGIVVMKNATASVSNVELIESIRENEPELTDLVLHQSK